MGETIDLDVNLRAWVRRDGQRRWVAICPSIGVASQGISPEDAKRALREAVELWFESCLERGVLDQALREANFRALPHGQIPPEGTDRVKLKRSVRQGDVLGDHFSIHVTIPAYQAAVFLGARA